jgi:uncharacterized protein (DUF1501 family)
MRPALRWLSLAEVAQLVRSRTALGATRQIFFTALGGFDTHSDQLNTQTALYQELSDAVSAFYMAMEDSSISASNAVTLFTESEFSRTFQPNTTGGQRSTPRWRWAAIAMPKGVATGFRPPHSMNMAQLWRGGLE